MLLENQSRGNCCMEVPKGKAAQNLAGGTQRGLKTREKNVGIDDGKHGVKVVSPFCRVNGGD